MSKEIIKSIQSLAAVKPFINLQTLNRNGNPILATVIEFVDFGHTEHLCKVGPHPSGFNGWEAIYKFPNGYGASVIRYQFMKGLVGSYGADVGLWELAVLDSTGKPCYSTPVTREVLGWLTPDDVNASLTQIQALPACDCLEDDTTSSSNEEDFFAFQIRNLLLYHPI